MHVRLPAELDGDIVVYASTRLVHTLMEHDLVDEVRLTVFPVVLRDARLAREGATARLGPPIEVRYATSLIRSNSARGRCRDRQLL